ncbi:MAG: hypothetical protein WBQ75_22945 [Acetobacteraceae bacterium]
MFKRIALAVLILAGLGGSVLAFAGATSQSAAACPASDHTT